MFIVQSWSLFNTCIEQIIWIDVITKPAESATGYFMNTWTDAWTPSTIQRDHKRLFYCWCLIILLRTPYGLLLFFFFINSNCLELVVYISVLYQNSFILHLFFPFGPFLWFIPDEFIHDWFLFPRKPKT